MTKEQIEAMIRPLEWKGPKGFHKHANVYYGFYRIHKGEAIYFGYDTTTIQQEPNESPESACERYHRKMVLSFLNLPE